MDWTLATSPMRLPSISASPEKGLLPEPPKIMTLVKIFVLTVPSPDVRHQPASDTT